jgi:adenosylcobyric acid synthase
MILGLCGGYQMLGGVIRDPGGSEGPPGTAPGLGLLAVETVLSSDKRLEPVSGTSFDGVPVTGYEMHMGVTSGGDCARPFAQLADGTAEGAMSADRQVVGTYMHGLFSDDRQRSAWLRRFLAGSTAINYEVLVEETLMQLAAHMTMHVDLDRLLSLSR